MTGDLLGHALAAVQARPDELVGVGPVGLGAGGAAGGAAVAAGHQQGPVRLAVGGVDGADLAGGKVDVVGVAVQADRLGAAAGPQELLQAPAGGCRHGGAGDARWDRHERSGHRPPSYWWS
ncbi:MAG TPA: hypothetical protein VFA46_04570 [Actinomycetes bacterium]|jgi:hypothetical protein|nr:hypothetical protein [Actinomycetes bacterium]